MEKIEQLIKECEEQYLYEKNNFKWTFEEFIKYQNLKYNL